MFAKMFACCESPVTKDDETIPKQLPELLASETTTAETATTASDNTESERVPAASELLETDRLILISDNLPSFEMLIKATKDTALVVPVQYSSWTLSELVEAITKRAGLPARQFKSVALLDHGKSGEFCLLKNVVGGSVELKEIKESEDLQDFLKHIAGYVQEPKELHKWKQDKDSRIDLMGCCVAQGKDGEELIDYLEELTKVNWCASTDRTGAGHEAEGGFDWVMESDPNVGCVADDYFHKDKLVKWQHTAPLPVVLAGAVARGVAQKAVKNAIKKEVKKHVKSQVEQMMYE
jgi:hypothetical protein